MESTPCVETRIANPAMHNSLYEGEHPSPFHPSLASLEFNGFVVIRGALSSALATECRDYVEEKLMQSCIRQGQEDHSTEALFGAIAPPRATEDGASNVTPVLHRWNVLVNGIDDISTPGLLSKPSDVVGRVLGEVLSASCGDGGSECDYSSSVCDLLELFCGRDAELCDLSGLVSDPGSEEQLLHYDTRYSSAAPSRGRVSPGNGSPRQGTQIQESDAPGVQAANVHIVVLDETVLADDKFGLKGFPIIPVLLPVREDSTLIGEVAELLLTENLESQLCIAAQLAGTNDIPSVAQQRMKRLITGFVALQDVTEAMGPTLIVPCTANKVAHMEVYEALNPAALTAALQKYQARGHVCTLRAGDMVLMDSRALHLGGGSSANILQYTPIYSNVFSVVNLYDDSVPED